MPRSTPHPITGALDRWGSVSSTEKATCHRRRCAPACQSEHGHAVRLTGYHVRMTAAAASGPQPGAGSPPFADASPAQVRSALIPEDVAEFDRQWRTVMAKATETLDLVDVLRTLESWRRVAWLTTASGPDGYRRMLARAEHSLRTGELPPGTVPLDQVKALIAQRLG